MWPFSDRHIAEREFRRIVVRVPNPLGDQIMATPALHAIRRRYADAHITWQGTGVAESIYSGMEWFDDFLVVGRREGVLRTARTLRERGFDAAILLAGSLRTALPPFLARVPHRIGYRWSGRTALLTAHWGRPRPEGKRAPYPTKQYFLDLVARLGATGGGRISLSATPEDRDRATEWLAAHGVRPGAPLLPMGIGAGFGPSKEWPPKYFAEVADRMRREHGAVPILLCAPGEEPIGVAVEEAAGEPLINTGRDPLPLGVTKAIIERSRLVLTNDTGPRHIAAALQVPVVTLMGSTDPTYTGTDLESQIVLREEGIECAPCHLKVCPIDHRCMVRLSPEKALAAMESLWSSGPGAEERDDAGSV